MYQRKTLNRMSPKTKRLAIICNQAEQVYRNLKRQVEVVRELELDSIALYNEQRFKRGEVKPTEHPDRETAIKEGALAKTTQKLTF